MLRFKLLTTLIHFFILPIYTVTRRVTHRKLNIVDLQLIVVLRFKLLTTSTHFFIGSILNRLFRIGEEMTALIQRRLIFYISGSKRLN